MRRFVSGVCVLGVLWVSAVVAGAQAKMKAEDLNRVMKKAGPIQQALVKALLAGDQATAKSQVAVLKSGILDSEPFWSANKRTDAMKISKTVVAKIDGLTKLIGASPLDSKAADRKSTRLNSSHVSESRMPSSA